MESTMENTMETIMNIMGSTMNTMEIIMRDITVSTMRTNTVSTTKRVLTHTRHLERQCWSLWRRWVSAQCVGRHILSSRYILLGGRVHLREENWARQQLLPWTGVQQRLQSAGWADFQCHRLPICLFASDLTRNQKKELKDFFLMNDPKRFWRFAATWKWRSVPMELRLLVIRLLRKSARQNTRPPLWTSKCQRE